MGEVMARDRFGSRGEGGPKEPVPAAPVLGGPGDDTLAAGGEGDVVFGFGGDDLLSSGFDGVLLDGGTGADRLVTEFAIASWLGDPVPEAITQTLAGGSGADRLELRIATSDRPASGVIAAVLRGESGADVISAFLRAEIGGAEPFEALVSIAGGGGADIIESAVLVGTDRAGDAAGFRGGNSIAGGKGDDSISADARAKDIAGGSGSTVAFNVLFGGEGNDSIAANAYGDPVGFDILAANTIFGGAGDDEVDAYAFVTTNSGTAAVNAIFGGEGNDVLVSRLLAGTNDGAGPVRGRLEGGTGNDMLVALAESDGNETSAAGQVVRGGTGDDLIRVDARAGGILVGEVEALVEGGSGDDDIAAVLRGGGAWSDAYRGATRVTASVAGGKGQDLIDVAAELVSAGLAPWDPEPPAFAADAELILAGDGGPDALSAAVAVTAAEAARAAVTLLGGGGDDRLALALEVTSGTEARAGGVLRGGGGNDVLAATVTATVLPPAGAAGAAGPAVALALLDGGAGDDVLSGEAMFLFRIDRNEGLDRILCPGGSFAGVLNLIDGTAALADGGEPGLADDIDAISAVSVEGGDVVLVLGSDTVIRFVGLAAGGGSFTGILDIVGDPARLVSDPGAGDGWI